MDYQAMDRLLDALGEGMAARLPALEATSLPEAAPVAPTRRSVVLRRARAAALSLAPVPVLALLFGTDAIGFLPVYAAFLLVMNVRGALETALGWALAWSTVALASQAVVPVPQPAEASFASSAGPASLFVGFAAFLTGGLFVAGLAAFRRGRARSSLPLAQAAWWGAGAGAVAAGAALVAAFVVDLHVATWFAPAVLLGLSALGAGSAAASTRFERLVEEGRTWPARIQGVLTISLSWGLSYGLLGLLVGVPLWIVVGLISGAAFAGVLGLAERRGLLQDLSVARLSVVGTVGATISAAVALPLYLILARGGGGPNVPFFLSLIAVLGACAAAVTVAIPRLMVEDEEEDDWMRELRRGPDLLEE